MTPGRFYMHKNAMDVAICVMKSFRIKQNRWSLRVQWVNLGYTGSPWPLGVVHRMEVADYKDWVDVTHTMANKRPQAGLPPA